MTGATPIRRQYMEIKRRFPQAIVFFRLGDFYETFDEDARLVARELEITLTSKPMGKDLRVPLAGVPHHSLQAHLKKLVSRGYKVAVCEQMEDPRKAKGLVEREVVRVVTPGTVVEEELLAATANNYLAAVYSASARNGAARHGLAYVDVTTGEFAATELDEDDLAFELARLAPAELLLPHDAELPAAGDWPRTAVEARCFEAEEAGRVLRDHFRIASTDGLGLRALPLAAGAAAAILAYLGRTQKAMLANVRDISVYNPSAYMVLDENARRHLEITASMRYGSRGGTLLDTIDCARTAMGSRLLAGWLSRPLLDVTQIEARLDRVAELHSDALRRAALRERLRDLPDVERILARITAGMAQPRDLAALRRALTAYPGIAELARLGPAESAAATADEALALLDAAIADDPAPAVGEGGVIRPGFSAQLDEARALTGDVRGALLALEAEERERTGIRSLRLAYNRVFGYYIEVSKANLSLVPADYQRRQTLVGGERFVTPRLKELEERILGAREAISELEQGLFRGVCSQLNGLAEGLQRAARCLAETDAFCALAETAARYGYVRPRLLQEPRLVIRDGRHPVVERGLGEGRFVPNDTEIDSADGQIVVLTGPNMAGKSTYLRQVALVVLLAQAGSFVPAAEAEVGLVDRIFTRIGAQDDVSRGESTFMVEMLETAAILRGAGRRSLILFDEVGRGTSTYDGLAIARAVVEYLHARPERAARTLFATHYHEMTRLAEVLPRVRNFSVAVTEQEGQVVFLHRIVPGGADRSYGIHVAELAGMPATVVQRAREVLSDLEDGAAAPGARARRKAMPQLPLLAPPSPIESDLAALDLDALTPLQALNKLYELKSQLRRD